MKGSIAGSVTFLHRFFRHGRGTHTLIFNLVFIVLFHVTESITIFGVAFGIFNHLVGDMFQGRILKYIAFPWVFQKDKLVFFTKLKKKRGKKR